MKKQVKIYQIEVTNGESHIMKFMRYDFIKKHHLEIRLPMYYKKVYEGEMDFEDGASTLKVLNEIYSKLNIGEKPQGYNGHSLSVSDLVKVDGGCFYVDSYGFVDITTDFEGKKVA